MAKNKYIDNEKMYRLLCELREFGDYDNEVFMLRKKNFKGLKFIDGVPNLSAIVDDSKEKVKKTKEKLVDDTIKITEKIVENTNAKTATEKRIIAMDLIEKDKAYKILCEERLKNETEEDTILRRKKVERIKDQLGTKFLKICNNIMKLPSFTNYSEDRKGNMISDATWVMTRYMNRYDLTKTNPFAYFTTVCRNAYIHQITEAKRHSQRFKSLSYIENLDGEEITLGEYDNV